MVSSLLRMSPNRVPDGPLVPQLVTRLGEALRGYRDALGEWEIWVHLATQDMKNRYKRSVVGPLWLAISLGLMVVGLSFLLGRIFGQERGQYLVYLTLGIMLWGLISSSITDGGQAFLGAESYIRQIPLPRQVYVLRSTLVSLYVFSFGLPVFLAAALFYRQALHPSLGWTALGFAIVVMACLAHASIMAYLSVLFRDLPPASASALQILYFFTPILYPVELMRDRGLGWLLHVNPLFYLLEAVRHPVLEGGAAPPMVYVGALAYTGAIWLVAIVVTASLDRRIPALL